ncbi:thiamine ABC transporter substrate-binding protein [Tomitella biformata]|uniref:thiamine ABC transporter substrate-binding protein n=1 Tax=Tomitella biformata TaxID=630403 RepID=UPI0004B8403A|nr:thiamine ABC transporter substrate-binding protein [Tomitella biformata]
MSKVQLGFAGIAMMVAAGLALSSCSAGAGGGDAKADVILVTHDSFALSDEVLAQFTEQTGLTVEVRGSGDAGALTSQLALTKENPLGDVAFGVDNAFASRAIEEGVFADYTSPAAAGGSADYAYPGSSALTAVDYGDVCLNIDTRYFTERQLAEPATITDLIKPEYKDLTVVESPATSSPGLAFLLATIAADGDGWQQYWKALADNGVQVTDGWTQAYNVEFSGSAGAGSRPIVVSYASSPPAEVGADGSAPPTKALPDTCFRQIEYAGVLTGAANPEGAQKLIDFLLSPAVQADLPGQMYVFPVQRDTPLPDAFARYAAKPEAPLTLAPSVIGEHRDEWIAEWRTLVQG